MSKLSESQAAFLRDNPFIGVVTTLRADGSPHNTPVWVEADPDGNPTFNTARGRFKPRNLERDPRIALTVVDPQNPFRWLTVSGTAALDDDGAVEQIDRLSQKYLNQTPYPWHNPAEQRVSVRIDVDKVDEIGIDTQARG